EKFREALGNLAIDIPLPALPQADDQIEINLIPLVLKERFSQKQGTSAKIKCSWISLFPLLFVNLEIKTSEWNDEYYFRIDSDTSCVAIGSAIAEEIASTDTCVLFKIARNSLERLIAYYSEAGLMVAGNEGQSPFTEAGQRIARRHHIAGASSSFVVVEGKVSVE